MTTRLNVLTTFCFIFFLVSCSSNKSVTIIGLNENIHHDDFEYAVTSYSVAKKIVSYQDSIIPFGNFYMINFRVMNKALRVNHPWSNSIAYIIDDDRNIYENNEDAQKILNSISPFGWKEKYLTHFQSTDTTILVFDLPVTIKHPCLMIRGETLMGDFFDRGRFRRTKIKLF
jgi:hypothetical protein